MPAPKFNFVPERQLGREVEDKGFIASISKKGILMFSSSVTHIYELDGKYIKLYGDIEKKIVGWSMIKGNTTLSDVDNARLLRKNIRSGIVLVSIQRLLSSLGIEKGKAFKNLVVKKHIAPMYADEIYYIQLT